MQEDWAVDLEDSNELIASETQRCGVSLAQSSFPNRELRIVGWGRGRACQATDATEYEADCSRPITT
jgi:hypothetical protein